MHDSSQDVHSHMQRLGNRLLRELQVTRGPALSTNDVEAMLQSLLRTAHHAIADVARQYNASLSVVNHLPVEVIGNIFAWLPFDQRILASHVCHRWRSVAIGTPRLWNRLDFRSRKLDLASVFLARAKNVPITLRVRGSSGKLPLLDCLREHMNHMQFLDIDLAACDPEDLEATFRTAAPILRSLRLFRCPPGFRFPDSGRLFDLGAPSLHVLALNHNILPETATPALLNLRVLICEDIPSPELLALRLRHLPSLESLAFSFRDAFYIGPSQTTLDFPAIKRLEIMDCPADANVQVMLPLLRHHEVPCIVITAPRTHYTLDLALEPLVRIDFMALRIRRRGLVTDFALYGGGRKRAFLFVAHDLAMRYLTTASFAHLATLIIHEGFWPTHTALPLAPALLRLTVVLTSPAQYDAARRLRKSISPGIFFLERGRAFVTPALQTVGLMCAWEPKGRPLTVSAIDVADFVTSALLTPIARPPCLVLRNVVLLEAPNSAEVTTLELRVAAVVVDTVAHEEDDLPLLLRPATNVVFGDNTF